MATHSGAMVRGRALGSQDHMPRARTHSERHHGAPLTCGVPCARALGASPRITVGFARDIASILHIEPRQVHVVESRAGVGSEADTDDDAHAGATAERPIEQREDGGIEFGTEYELSTSYGGVRAAGGGVASDAYTYRGAGGASADGASLAATATALLRRVIVDVMPDVSLAEGGGGGGGGGGVALVHASGHRGGAAGAGASGAGLELLGLMHSNQTWHDATHPLRGDGVTLSVLRHATYVVRAEGVRLFALGAAVPHALRYVAPPSPPPPPPLTRTERLHVLTLSLASRAAAAAGHVQSSIDEIASADPPDDWAQLAAQLPLWAYAAVAVGVLALGYCCCWLLCTGDGCCACGRGGPGRVAGYRGDPYNYPAFGGAPRGYEPVAAVAF
jgi:hypothetical protein